jgi:hypothetical protein
MKRTPPKRPPTPGRNLGVSRFCLSQELNLPGGVMSLSSARPQLRVQNARRSSFVHANCMIKDPSEPSLAPQTVELLAPILPTLHRTLPRAAPEPPRSTSYRRYEVLRGGSGGAMEV